jgi:hypothetical protein
MPRRPVAAFAATVADLASAVVAASAAGAKTSEISSMLFKR